MPIDWSALLFYEALSIGVGLLIYHGIAGYYTFAYYVKRRHEAEEWKIQRRFLSSKLHWRAVWMGTANMTLGGILSGLFIYAVDNGLWTRLYFSVSDYGWPYLIVSLIGLFVFVDCCAYWVHRALHIRVLFKHIHRHHHRFVQPTPYASIALHPAELMALQAAAFMALFLVPLHPAVFATVLIYILVYNIVDHSGVHVPSHLPWQPHSRFHDDHHKHFHVNFGQHLLLWDRLFGTLRRTGRRYGREVFGGRGVSDGVSVGERFESY